jgi:hypothetical protein
VEGWRSVGKLSFIVPDDVELAFRMKVLRKYGSTKGALSAALTEAMRLWTEKDP